MRHQGVFDRQEGKCFYCGVVMREQPYLGRRRQWPKKMRFHPDMATIDHVIPISRGGTEHYTNLVYACFRCNTMKGSDMPEGTEDDGLRYKNGGIFLETAQGRIWQGGTGE
jgi:5-methylcytosine-specific restriction endonuclease McrA